MSEEIKVENKESTIQPVYSYKIAEALVADYPFFRQLKTIEVNHRDPSKRVWFFRRSQEFDEAFDQLKAEAIKDRIEQAEKEVSI